MILLPLPIPCSTPLSMKKKKKTFFTKYYFNHWTNVVLKLEEQEPLLTLCAVHWKAEHILNTILTGALDQKASASKENASNLDNPAVSLHTPSLMTNPSAPSTAFQIHLQPSQRRKRRPGKRGVLRIAKNVHLLFSFFTWFILLT